MGRLYDVVEYARLAAGQGGQPLELHGVVVRSFPRVGDWNLRNLSSDQIRGHQIRRVADKAGRSQLWN